MRVCALFWLLVVLVPGTANAQEHSEGDHEIGSVEFHVSCAGDVGHDFNRAVALLHHMMYVESRAAFEAIRERAPGCAMAPWGVAMTLFQPLWPARPGPEQLQRGWELVQHAKELEPGSQRERALIAAAEAFYLEPSDADWWTRIRRWAAAMEQAYEASPQDIETNAFYALSQLAMGPVSENRMSLQAHAAEILLGVYDRVPTHPGAIHYTIHANDVQGRAGESTQIVRRYNDIAPSVPHALHMPTHIFVRLGEWPSVIEWNRKSADAALRFPVGGAISLHHVHAMDYLVYAHLQRGADASARAVLDEAMSREPYQEDFGSAFHLAALPARYAVERRAWEEAATIEVRSPGYLAWDRYWWPEAMTWFARGLGAIHTDDIESGRLAENRMRELAQAAGTAGEQNFQRYIEIDRLVLAGWLAHAEGNAEGAVQSMREAAELEATVQKHPITPGTLLPPYEALGDLMSELDRPRDALEAYEASLEIWPKRYRSLLGAARAARHTGNAEKASAFYEGLLEVVGDAKTERPGVEEARVFLRAGG